MAALTLYLSPKYLLNMLRANLDGELLLAREIYIQAYSKPGVKMNPYFFALDRGYPEQEVVSTINLMVKKGLIEATEIPGQRGSSYELKATDASVKQLVACKAETAAMFANR